MPRLTSTRHCSSRTSEMGVEWTGMQPQREKLRTEWFKSCLLMSYTTNALIELHVHVDGTEADWSWTTETTENTVIKVKILLTTVQPLFMLCVSLCWWAQKSTVAVHPENGRPVRNPIRQSLARLSYLTCVTRKRWQIKYADHWFKLEIASFDLDRTQNTGGLDHDLIDAWQCLPTGDPVWNYQLAELKIAFASVCSTEMLIWTHGQH